MVGISRRAFSVELCGINVDLMLVCCQHPLSSRVTMERGVLAHGQDFLGLSSQVFAVIFVEMFFSLGVGSFPACKYTPEIFGSQGKNDLIATGLK